MATRPRKTAARKPAPARQTSEPRAPIVDPPADGPAVDVGGEEPEVGPVTDPAPNNSARPNDTPIEEREQHFTQSTFAERAAARESGKKLPSGTVEQSTTFATRKKDRDKRVRAEQTSSK